ncbi:hypothetical protein F8M41_012143 [Gigaspora margarita]|uniref:Uncharacterized protein n=1 Tax=Gigaspora margarita TaxID=4874 RepID=A0A8H3X182_GIGMA|nr:hypothetical protein F8M41_012143 [Gigaspora margarita]
MTSLPLEWLLLRLNNLDKSLIPKKICHDNNNHRNPLFGYSTFITSMETSNSIVHGVMIYIEQQHFTILRYEPICLWKAIYRTFKQC